VVVGHHSLLKDIETQQDIVRFLDSKKKNGILDPDKQWIRTWNDYLQRIKYFMHWLHNDSVPMSEWQTPYFVRIKKKKTSRISRLTNYASMLGFSIDLCKAYSMCLQLFVRVHSLINFLA
jgi:hypothetical protein